ncbi:MAG: stage II sporulation protein M [Flavobacteriaceae bacterium]|jgi:uncharacterized membrane protein SpoIIM required for sporulation|nr:stage II sporulation protein M [Flavobacteriaceae bacterium]
MREVAFIKQNKEKWLGIETVVSGNVKKNPDELSSIYINLVNDLSFSQTYYPKSKTTIYLNHLASSIFQKIYKTRRIEKNRLVYFFKTDVPLLMYQYRKYLLYAFGFFIIFTLIGLVSAIYDKDFNDFFLSEGYVNKTVENIKNHNAVGVYQEGSQLGSTISLIFNNIGVGVKMYVYGIFAGVGTLLYLLINGIMLGTIHQLLYEYGEYNALTEFSKGLWLHGVFEIFAMIVEAAAGLILGASILFPRTYSRFNSLVRGFRDSFKIFISTVPFTICAGIIEGFITRYALTMPLFLDLLIIFGTFSFIAFYYFIYPQIVAKKMKADLIT